MLICFFVLRDASSAQTPCFDAFLPVSDSYHPILVLPFLQDFDVANARVGAERNPLKTQVIYCANDLDAAPFEWRIRDVENVANVSTVTAGSITLGVAVGPRQCIVDQLLPKADVIRAMHERVQLSQDQQTEFALLRQRMGVSRIKNILRVHGHTILQEERAAEIYDEVGQRSLERLFPGLTGQSGIGYRARDFAAPAHLGALTAAKPRIQAMIRDAVWAGPLPEHLLKTRLAAVIGTGTSTFLSALDNDEQATAKLYVQKAAQAADEAWQQTIGGLQGPGVTNPTIASLQHLGSASQDEDGDDMDFSTLRKNQLSAPQLQAQLSRLTDRTALLSKGAWQQVTKNRRPVPHAGLTPVVLPPGPVRGKRP